MKASFKDEYQTETGICEHKESSQSQVRTQNKKDSGYKDKVKVGYSNEQSIPSGGSFVTGTPSQYTQEN